MGAAAALSGLIFVAVSINLNRVLEYPALPGRAGTTVSVLGGVLFISTLLLLPGQSLRTVGVELLCVGTCNWAVPMIVQLRSILRQEEKVVGRVVNNVVLTQLATVPFVVAGFSVLARAGGGLYWVAPGVLFSFVVGGLNAWVLLVEILR